VLGVRNQPSVKPSHCQTVKRAHRTGLLEITAAKNQK
jgi:hypothetical protein